jgi:hypothetical protein
VFAAFPQETSLWSIILRADRMSVKSIAFRNRAAALPPPLDCVTVSGSDERRDRASQAARRAPVPLTEIVNVSLATLAIVASLRTGRPVRVPQWPLSER